MRRGLLLAVLPVLASAMRFSPRATGRAIGIRMVSTTTAFADLPINDQLKKALNQVGLVTATPVQQATLPPLLEGKDVVAKARTGTGKTVAFLVPTLQRLIESAHDKGQIEHSCSRTVSWLPRSLRLPKGWWLAAGFAPLASLVAHR